MALSDVQANLTDPDALPWRTCGTCHALDTMSEADAGILTSLLSNRSLRFKVIAKALADDPDSPSVEWEALSRHAAGDCKRMRESGMRLR